MMLNEYERTFIKSFIIKTKQERYISLFSSDQGRLKLIRGLAHMKDFDPDYVESIPAKDQNVEGILNHLSKRKSCENCYIISEDITLDRKIEPLSFVLPTVVGTNMGTLLVCIPEKLAYYEGEDERLILSRRY